jgi:hypothetical protein
MRNPERAEALLRTLAELEGTRFDAAGQEQFFGLQIKKRLYRPTRDTLGDELASAVYGSDQSEDLSDEVVSSILKRYRGSMDSAGRGRTAVAVLNRFGLSIALQSHGPVVITPLGKKWLSGEIGDEELFTRFLLRWQYPNPIEKGYKGFDIKPFLAVLHLIHAVNKGWEGLGHKPVGLSKEEYRLFALSLRTPQDVQDAADHIIQLRQELKLRSGKEHSDYLHGFARQRVIQIFGYTTKEALRKRDSNLKAYADSSVRYFRISGLIALRGAGRYIDIATDKRAEVDSVINTLPLASMHFTSTDAYLSYLGDLSYNLPWQNEADLRNISENLTTVLQEEAEKTSITFDSAELEHKTLPQRVSLLQERINDVRIEKLRGLRHDLGALDEAIERLSNVANPRYESITARPSLDFEWYAFRALAVLNDAHTIEPSFKVGDDGLPTGFRGNKCDITCEYGTFGMTVEVTLLTGRDQWYAEGQPVMRHLRDFEDMLPSGKGAFCIFVAPYIHRDTLNQFWTSNKYEFEGKPQRIIPFTIEEFVTFLRKARSMVERDTLEHTTLEKLLDSIAKRVAGHTDSIQWRATIKSIIAEW